ncbi:ABC transporter permease [Psychromarinibacter sp. C21-152]|uniref:Transport permease protein n=1 Tax=Psychromarinibacter sediminicola TaxID=3033385 RepID=A0AAE3NV34_9RHOB|nr:ABC transporter permease [Psychromarinibacter sediminicola]MDF0602566.1 ABC transporter permease [Psychromarinibacter sediminicola]
MTAQLLWHQVRHEIRLYMRDRQSVFWSFMMPILLLLLLGAIFGGDDRAPVIGIADGLPPEIAARIEAQFPDARTIAGGDPAARVDDRSVDAMVAPGPEGWRIAYDPVRAPSAQAAARLTEALFADAPRLAPTGSPDRGYADFLLPGLVAFTIVSTCLFSIGIGIVSHREKGELKRVLVTPLPKWAFLAGQLGSRVVLVLLQTALLAALGWLVFGADLTDDWPAFLLVLLLGVATFSALGFFVATVSGTVAGAAAVANLIFIPMIFLSGVYFPVDGLPAVLSFLIAALPLTPLVEALRALGTGADLGALWPQIAALLAWTALLIAGTLRWFRWT